jgi:tetratricopeptide (TPR) repeat protein
MFALAADGKIDPQAHARIIRDVKASDDVEAMALLADLALRLADYETASERAQVVIERDPGHFRALRVAGSAALASGDSRRAISMFTRALTLDENRSRAFASLARAFFQTGEYVRASHLYRRAADEGMSRAGDVRNWHRAEMLNTADGRPEMVVETALASTAASPTDLMPWFRLLVNDHPETPGLADRLNGAFLETGNVEFALLRARHLLDVGGWEPAYQALLDVRSIAEKNILWYRLMRRALQSVPPGFDAPERLEEITGQAIDVAREALERNPDAVDGYLTLSRVIRDAETPEDGRRFPRTPGKDQALDFAAAALTQGVHRDAELSVIDLLIRQQRYADAVWRAESSTTSWHDSPEVWAVVSATRLEMGDVPGAIDAAATGLSFHPGHGACVTALIRAELAANESADAAVHIAATGARSDMDLKRLSIDASLRVGDVLTALDELGTMSPEMRDAPTWLQETSDTLDNYGRGDPPGERIVLHDDAGAGSWPSLLEAVGDATDVFIIRHGATPPDEVLDHMASHRRPHVGLAFTNWPVGADTTATTPGRSRVVLASAGDIKVAHSGQHDVDVTIERLGHRLKTQLIPVTGTNGHDPDRHPGRP